MAILEITVVPVGTGATSPSSHLSETPGLLQASSLGYQIRPTGTVVEGPTEALLDLAGRLHEAGFAAGAPRVYTHLCLDDRHDVVRPVKEKVRRLEAASWERRK